MAKTRRIRLQNRRRSARLRGGMQRRITHYFPTVSAAASYDPEQPPIDTTSNGRPFHLLSESEVSGLKAYDRAEYIKWKKDMEEFEHMAATLPPVKNVNHTSNGRHFKNLKKNNIAALSEKNTHAYSRWRRIQMDERLKALPANLTPEQLDAAYAAIAAELLH